MSKNYTQFSNSFLFRRLWAEAICLLSDEDAGRIVKAIFTHTRGGSASKKLEDRPDLRPLAASIVASLEAASKRWIASRGGVPKTTMEIFDEYGEEFNEDQEA